MAYKSEIHALNSLVDRQNSVLLDNKLDTAITFVATTTGAVDTHDLLTITGVVALQVFGVCSTDVAGSGTIEVGTALSTAGVIAQTTGTAIDVGDIWHDAAPDASVELTSVLLQNIITQDVAYIIAGNTLTGGVVTFYIRWAPISDDGNVALA